MTAGGWWLVLLSAGFTFSANLLLRAGLDRAGGFGGSLSERPNALLHLAGQPLFDLGFISYGVAGLILFRMLSTETLSTAYPLSVSFAFIFVTLGARTLFRESITSCKLAGSTVVLLGIFLVGWN